ncbi:hypothetical protein [Thalassospira sp. TSL5-1]|uniref:hypothetical protein n=1 Tax=Thalassospira sp. TSL5-1 TaxID=1544451 RepID=UPI000AFB1464|nr:hypothetical protein [Thalassospira sp. TSL5-1]
MGFRWSDQFLEFQESFDPYVADFPPYGPHEKAVSDYRNNAGAVWAGNFGTAPGQPLFLVGNAILILLNGYQKLTPKQRKVRKNLLAKWNLLRGSVHAANRETIQGPSLWCGITALNEQE